MGDELSSTRRWQETGGQDGKREGRIEGEPNPETLILSQGLPNLTATICIWEEWITIHRHTEGRIDGGVGGNPWTDNTFRDKNKCTERLNEVITG